MRVTFVGPHGNAGHPKEHYPVFVHQGHFYEAAVHGLRTGDHNIYTRLADRLRVDQ
jgi:hypothetical protein